MAGFIFSKEYEWNPGNLQNMGKATFACCFSNNDNRQFKNNYGSQIETDKVLVKIDLKKFLSSLKELESHEQNKYEQIDLCFGAVNYLNWKYDYLNPINLLNYISYAFIRIRKLLGMKKNLG